MTTVSSSWPVSRSTSSRRPIWSIDVGDRRRSRPGSAARTWSSVISTSSMAHTVPEPVLVRRARLPGRSRARHAGCRRRAYRSHHSLRDRVRVVRVRERDDEAERPLVARPHVLVQGPLGREADLVVEVELVGADARSGVGHRRHVVVPVRAVVGMLPVGRPPVVGRVDVGRQPLLETVQLVGTAEVHLARRARSGSRPLRR